MSDSDRADQDREPPQPTVTVVIPMRDEAGFIDACLEGFASQSYSVDHLDVVVVDANSTDGSRQWVDDYTTRNPWCRVIENPIGTAASGFNRGIEAAKGDFVCIFSAHGVPADDFIEAAVRVLEDTGAEGVGGLYLHEGLDPVSNAIGLAMVSPFGMASPHRSANTRRVVDTISHPVYRRSALREVGPFDESLHRNADYELNWRMRDLGMTLVFDPSIRSVYRPRPSLKALSSQFWWYGKGKAGVARRHPRSTRPRHLVPPAAVAGLALSPVALGSSAGRRLAFLGAATYVVLCAAATAQSKPSEHDADATTLMACFPTMHLSWGTGFLLGLVQDLRREAGSGD